MTQPRPPQEFYVAISLEADQPEPIADIVFGGQGIGDVRMIEGEWKITIYAGNGTPACQLPFGGFLDALIEANLRIRPQ